MARIEIFGVGIDNITKADAVREALEDTGEPCVVFTPNAVMLDACRRDRKYAELLSSASLVLPDGAGVLMAARRAGLRFRERVPGIDFAESLLTGASERGMRVFLLGGSAGVAERAGENLSRRWPGVRICGTEWGYFRKNGEEDLAVVSMIRACRPDILFVGFGFPLQEEWIRGHVGMFPDVKVIAGIGGSFDVWAGSVRRAPSGFSRAGAEWAWRMVREPRRMRRLPALVRFALTAKAQKL